MFNTPTLCCTHNRIRVLKTGLPKISLHPAVDFMIISVVITEIVHQPTVSLCRNFYSQNCSLISSAVRGELSPKISEADMTELPRKSVLAYHSPIFEAWKVPKRPIEVSCDVMQHLLAYRTAVETRTNSSGMRTHTGQHSRLPCMHTLSSASLVVHSVQKSYRN